MAAFLDQYEPLDVIGHGSFGIFRKLGEKRWRERNSSFERMSEHDRKQIVAEVYVAPYIDTTFWR
jgi:NIMA (never in mitosis gene a)-related kinase